MKSLADLEEIRKRTFDKINLRLSKEDGMRIVVGMATCGIAAGARPVMNAFIEELHKRSISNVQVVQTGCIGMCKLEPIVEVYMPDKEKVTYVNMTPEKAVKVVAEQIVNDRPIIQYTLGEKE
jgi:NADP-reducing hydrogenase subunit HndB